MIYRGVQCGWDYSWFSEAIGSWVHQMGALRHFVLEGEEIAYGDWSYQGPFLVRVIQDEISVGWEHSAPLDRPAPSRLPDTVEQINGGEASLLATARQLREAAGETFPLDAGSFASGLFAPSNWVGIPDKLPDWTRVSLARPVAVAHVVPADPAIPIPDGLDPSVLAHWLRTLAAKLEQTVNG